MSKLGTKKSGGKTTFGGVNTAKQGGTPGEFSTILATEALRLKLNPKIGYKKLIAQALGIIEAENGFDGSAWFGQGASGHIGPFAMSPAFGSVAERMNKVSASRIALESWKGAGESWYSGWTKWEGGETEGTGESRAPKFYRIAEEGLKRAGVSGYVGEPEGTLGEPKLPGQNLAEEVVSDAESVGEFLGELADTLFNFKKLGALAASAMAWFLKLILKAIWDYVIHPALNWVERATSWYWVNFFGEGVEPGSGVGYVLRSNAGIITIGFWALGYGALFTDGTSLSPVGKASHTLLGQGFKTAEGKVARRSLIKPSQVKEKTPDKPKPKVSTIPIERAQTFSVGRKRAVSVTSGSAATKVTEGRKSNGSSERQSAPVARPQKQTQSSQQRRLILPPGAVAETPAQIKAKATLTTKQSRTGVAPRSGSGDTTPVASGSGGPKRRKA